jgi:hypothetical protein
LSSDLNGVEARWEDEQGKSRWSGWLPHLDLEVCRALLRGSAEHERLWPLLSGSGWLVLRGQLDLWQMLQPAIQPGAKLDYERPSEDIVVRFASKAEGYATFGTNMAVPFGKDGEMFVARLADQPRENRWIPFELKLRGNVRCHCDEFFCPGRHPNLRRLLPAPIARRPNWPAAIGCAEEGFSSVTPSRVTNATRCAARAVEPGRTFRI